MKYEIIDAAPAIGMLYRVNGFLSGHVRLRGRGKGAYPYKYLEMLDAVFGEVASPGIIEACSGLLDHCFTVDINPENKPRLVADAQQLPLPDGIFSRWRCDPPYNAQTAAKMYKTKLPKLIKLLKEGARVIRRGSLMFLLCSQNYQWCPPGVKRIGIIFITVVPNNEIRACNIYKKID